MQISKILFPLVVLSLLSCTKKEKAVPVARPAEEVVKEFVELSARAKSLEDRRTLQDLCAGELKRAFERMSDEEFRLSYLNQQITLKRIQILDQSVEKEAARVHYQVFLQNAQGTDSTQEANEREVELKLSQGAWYIEFIRTRGTDKLAFTRGMIF